MLSGPTCIITALGVWHFVNSIDEESKRKLLKEDFEKNQLIDIQKKRREGFNAYVAYLQNQEFEAYQPKSEIIGSYPLVITSTSIDYAICAFTLATICEMMSRNGLKGITWLFATPLAAIGLITVYYSLFNIFE